MWVDHKADESADPDLARKQQVLFSSLLDCKKFLTNFEKKLSFYSKNLVLEENKKGSFMIYDTPPKKHMVLLHPSGLFRALAFVDNIISDRKNCQEVHQNDWKGSKHRNI